MALADILGAHRNEAGIVTAIAVLQQRFGEKLKTSQALREQHAHTTTYLTPQLPDAVLFATHEGDVREAVRICATHKVPVIAYGTGTSLEGNVNAPEGGLCIDLMGMNAILEVNAGDLDVTVQPGVTREQLNAHLRDMGLFFPIDPGANASLGGMAATRASGTNAVRYGTMRDNVISLKAVLPDGRVIKTGGRARKSSAGYDLTRLIVGSEGTLGVITELTLRLQGIPEAMSAAIASFPDIGSACEATIAAMQTGIPMARIELLDTQCVEAINNYSKTEFPAFAAAAAGISREQGFRCRTGRELRRNREGLRRHRLRVGCKARGEEPAVEGTARCLLGIAGSSARQAVAVDRCLRADLAAGRMRDGDRARHRRSRALRSDTGACRRWKFPRGGDVRPGRSG